MNRKVYPYDEDFQDAVVTLILRDPTFLHSYNNVIDPTYFDSEQCSLITRLVKGYFEEHHEIPNKNMVMVMVTDHITRLKVDAENREVLINMVEAIYEADTSTTNQIAERVIDFGRSRTMETMALQLSNMIASGDDADRMWELIDKTREIGYSSSDGLDMNDALRRADEICLASSLYNSALKIQTLIPSIDYNFNGGVGRKEVAVALGPTGIGKSTWLVNMGSSAIKQGVPVIHLSVNELEEEDLVARYAANLTGFTSYEIASGTAGDLYKRKIGAILDEYQPKFYCKYIEAGTTISAVRSYISRLKFKYGIDPGLIIIDNVDDMSPGSVQSNKKETNTYHDQGNVYVQLKALAHSFDTAMWTDCQTQRGAGRAEYADIDMMADSIKKARKADAVISINQRYPEEFNQKIMRVYTLKARRTGKATRKITCFIDSARMRLQEIPQEDEAK